MTDTERWNNPKMRSKIEDAIMESAKDFEHIPFLLWCVEGAPWEEWTKNHIKQTVRAKAFFDNVPRFV